jgi:hypothetical protein
MPEPIELGWDKKGDLFSCGAFGLEELCNRRLVSHNGFRILENAFVELLQDVNPASAIQKKIGVIDVSVAILAAVQRLSVQLEILGQLGQQSEIAHKGGSFHKRLWRVLE